MKNVGVRVRWIARQIELEREIACDDVVVETMGLPRSYAACLTRMVELCGGVRAEASWAGTAAAGARSHLARRVDRLLDRNRQAGTRTGKARLATAIGMVAAFALMDRKSAGGDRVGDACGGGCGANYGRQASYARTGWFSGS